MSNPRVLSAEEARIQLPARRLDHDFGRQQHFFSGSGHLDSPINEEAEDDELQFRQPFKSTGTDRRG